MPWVLLPGLWLVVREYGNSGRLQFFATPDAIAMASMSPCRVAWMGVVARGLQRGWAGALACARIKGQRGLCASWPCASQTEATGTTAPGH